MQQKDSCFGQGNVGIKLEMKIEQVVIGGSLIFHDWIVLNSKDYRFWRTIQNCMVERKSEFQRDPQILIYKWMPPWFSTLEFGGYTPAYA